MKLPEVFLPMRRPSFIPARVAAIARCLTIGCLAFAGCGESGPPLHKVEGTVSLDGKPLKDAEITFIPDPANAHVTAGSAFSADDGTYKARFQSSFGLAAGKYVVTVRKTEVADMSKVPEAMKNDPAQLEMMGLTKPVTKDNYSSPEKSPFKIEVASGGGPFNFELDSKGR